MAGKEEQYIYIMIMKVEKQSTQSIPTRQDSSKVVKQGIEMYFHGHFLIG